MAKGGKKGKKDKKSSARKIPSITEEINAEDVTIHPSKPASYWRDLHYQVQYMDANQRYSRPWTTSYYTTIPMVVYRTPIGPKPEGGAKKGGKKKK